jgi:RNase P subunit RPR2
MIKIYIFESVADALAFEHPQPQTEPKREAVPEVTGGGIPESPAPEKPARHYKKRKKVNPEKEAFKERILGKAKSGKCGYCHSTEHRGKDCPDKPSGSRKSARVITCKNCGKSGHMAKTCPEKKPIQPELTQEQMDFIKELSEQGKSIAEIVMETGLPSKVVKENMY